MVKAALMSLATLAALLLSLTVRADKGLLRERIAQSLEASLAVEGVRCLLQSSLKKGIID